MSINQAILYLIAALLVWAAIDKYLLGGRFGYGPQFEAAFEAMGPLALSIVGIMCVAPLLGKWLTPLITPLFGLIGVDPAMLAGSLLASDMGGFSLAQAMTTNPNIVLLSGIFLGSMMGVALIFVIPYTATVIDKEDHPALCKGIMAGIIPIPLGCLAAGLISGMPLGMLVLNLLPATLLAAVLALGLWRWPGAVIKLFGWFAKGMTLLIGVFLVAAMVEMLTGLVLIPGMDPIGPQLEVVGYIAVMLAGAYPLIHLLKTVFEKPLIRFGKLIGVNTTAVAGMLACLASAIPLYPMVKDMDPRGKVMAIAFSIGAGFALGDILAYTSVQAPDAVFAMIVGKLLAGALGAIIAGWLVPKRQKA